MCIGSRRRHHAFALKQPEPDMPVEEECWKAGISDATVWNWRKKWQSGAVCPKLEIGYAQTDRTRKSAEKFSARG
jgi:hypothetical protein